MWNRQFPSAGRRLSTAQSTGNSGLEMKLFVGEETVRQAARKVGLTRSRPAGKKNLHLPWVASVVGAVAPAAVTMVAPQP
jgi:hypothetical protein